MIIVNFVVQYSWRQVTTKLSPKAMLQITITDGYAGSVLRISRASTSGR